MAFIGAGDNNIELTFRSLPFGNSKLYQWGYYKRSGVLTLHSLDGPAMIMKGPDGVTAGYWLVHGMYHREDGPAWIDLEKHHRKWYLNGKLHRDGGPAITLRDNIEEWWQHGTMHREDGPAWTNEDKISWYYNGKLHRTGGPAIIHANGNLEWAINGRCTSLAGILSEEHISKEEKIIIRLKYAHSSTGDDN